MQLHNLVTMDLCNCSTRWHDNGLGIHSTCILVDLYCLRKNDIKISLYDVLTHFKVYIRQHTLSNELDISNIYQRLKYYLTKLLINNVNATRKDIYFSVIYNEQLNILL